MNVCNIFREGSGIYLTSQQRVAHIYLSAGISLNALKPPQSSVAEDPEGSKIMREEVGMTQPVIGEQGQMAQLSSSTSGIAIHSALFIRKKCAYNMQLPKEGLYILFCNNRYF